MRTGTRSVLTAVAALALLVGLGVSVAAADQSGRSSLYLPNVDNARILFDDGGEFFKFENVLPGDSLTQHVDIRNQREEAVTFYLRATSEMQAVKLLEQCTMRLMQGDRILYEGNLTGRPTTAYDNDYDMTQESYGISLGQVAAGGSTQIRAYIHVPLSVDNDFAKAIGLIKWEIRAEIPDPVPTVSGSESGNDNSVSVSQPEGGNSVSQPEGGNSVSQSEGGNSVSQPEGGNSVSEPGGGSSISTPNPDSEPGNSNSTSTGGGGNSSSSSSTASSSSSSSSSSRSNSASSRAYYNLGGVDVQPATTNSNTARAVDVIQENDVPLAGDLYSIPDDQTPLASLPQTGGAGDTGTALLTFTMLTGWGLWKKP